MERAARQGPQEQLTLAWYTASLFGSACLLFMVEPMAARMLLPFVGGAAAVWTTALLFFQALLLGGYAYAHLVATRLGRRTQVTSHLLLLSGAALTLPIQFAGAGAPAPGSNPIPWVLGTLAIRVGLPFFCLTTLSPLLQTWFVRTGHQHSSDPYFLYRASNLGSFAALVAYPVLVERFAGLGAQARAWQVAYILLVLLLAGLGVRLWRAPSGVGETPAPPPERIRVARLLRWIALSTVPSLWMLAVTTYFTSQIRPIPLLWVIPLALYLLSFVLVFARRSLPLEALARTYPYLAVVLLGLMILGGNRLPFLPAAILQFGAFFVAAVLCHGQLARDRPAAGGLTVFYLALAVGGALGGFIGAVVAPILFPDIFEFPLAIIAAGFLLPAAAAGRGRQAIRKVAVAAALGVALLAVATFLVATHVPARLAGSHLTEAATAADLVRLLVVLPVPGIAAIAFSRTPAALAVVLGVVFLLSQLALGSEPTPIYQSRDFYGVHRVLEAADHSSHVYENAGVVHGLQLQAANVRDVPATYYARSGPAGDILLHRAADGASVAVIGLGAGSMACLGRPGQTWTFYEIDPEVVRIARDPHLFTFLRDCTPRASIILGDGRLEVAKAPAHGFDILVVDAFGGDAPPVHVLTREAMAMYTSKLRPGGLLLFNISNRYIDFRTVLTATGQSLGMKAYARRDTEATALEAAQGKTASEWLVLAARPVDGTAVESMPGWSAVEPVDGGPIWTDDYSNLLRVLRLS